MLTRISLAVLGALLLVGSTPAQTVNGYRIRNTPTPSVWDPTMNTSVVSVSPYWRPSIIQTPRIYIPGMPYVNYNQYYSYHATPFGYGWTGYTNVWGGVYDPYYSPYGVLPSPVYPSYSRYSRAGYEVSAAGFTQGMEAGVSSRLPTPVGTISNDARVGSYSAYGAYLPGTGTYLNPFTGAAYNPITGGYVR